MRWTYAAGGQCGTWTRGGVWWMWTEVAVPPRMSCEASLRCVAEDSTSSTRVNREARPNLTRTLSSGQPVGWWVRCVSYMRLVMGEMDVVDVGG